jgi:3',5'-cyclic AMP phosphodiesterase CpdA
MNENAIRLLILGDFHHNFHGKSWETTGEGKDNVFMGPKMLERLDAVLTEKAPLVDHIIFAGDMTNRGMDRQYAPYEKILNRFKNDQLSVAPGNHDMSINPVANVIWRRKFRKKFLDNFGRFMFPDPETPKVYPYLKDVGHGIVIVGIDTTAGILDRCRSSIMGFSASIGRIGPIQLQRLRGILHDESLSGKRLVLAMHHDPFVRQNPWTKLSDLKPFLQLLDEASRTRRLVVVCGHNHNGKIDRYNDNVIHIQAPAFCGQRTTDKGLFYDISINDDLSYSINK